MNVCLIGDSLITLSLAKNLTNKNIKVFNYTQSNKKKSTTRTIGITKDNLKFFTEEVDLNGNSCSEERAINHLLGCIRNENIRNIQYLNKPIRPVHIYFND